MSDYSELARKACGCVGCDKGPHWRSGTCRAAQIEAAIREAVEQESRKPNFYSGGHMCPTSQRLQATIDERAKEIAGIKNLFAYCDDEPIVEYVKRVINNYIVASKQAIAQIREITDKDATIAELREEIARCPYCGRHGKVCHI